jgi:hypothetical protein
MLAASIIRAMNLMALMMETASSYISMRLSLQKEDNLNKTQDGKVY